MLDAADAEPEAEEIRRWCHTLWWRVCEGWTKRTGDPRFPTWPSEILAHLYRWAVASALIPDVRPHPFHRYHLCLSPLWRADRPAVVAEANRHLTALWAAKTAALERERAEDAAKAAAEAAKIRQLASGGDER